MKSGSTLDRFLLTTLTSVVVALSFAVVNGQPFRPKSDLPSQLRDTGVDRPIDTSCADMAGAATVAKHQAQNRAKNNFYIAGTPVTVSSGVFSRLQKAVEQRGIPFGGSDGLPNDRSVLRNLITHLGNPMGEGTLVRFAAVVLGARAADASNSDGVNCNGAGPENNDVHVDLGRQPGDDRCTSLTATISPHFRPDNWASIGDFEFFNRPLRFTGPLFFDASHRPCRRGSRASPARMSIWEIRPVYAIDVCRFTTASKCRASEELPWQSLNEWAGQQEH